MAATVKPITKPAPNGSKGPINYAPRPVGQPTKPAYNKPSQRERSQDTAAFLGYLSSLGLDELRSFVDSWVRKGMTWAEIQMMLEDPNTQPGRVVDRLYPELREVREAGKPPVSIADIQNARLMTQQGLHERGLSSYVDVKKLAHDWIVGEVSVAEGLDRVDAVAEEALAFAREDPATKAELEGWERFYGVAPTAAEILGMALKPDIATADVKRRAEAVRLDREAGRAGFGDLSQTEAERLVDLGAASRQAGATFGALTANRELFSALDAGEDVISREDQLAAGFTNSAAAQKRIEDRRRRRVAGFQGGGGLAATRSGFGGLATSSDA